MENSHITALNAMGLHDNPLKSIQFNFEQGEIKIELLEYSEIKKDYYTMYLLFKQVKKMDLGELSYIFDEDPDKLEMEIYRHETSIKGDLYETEFIILTGFSQPGFKLSFTHKDFTMSILE